MIFFFDFCVVMTRQTGEDELLAVAFFAEEKKTEQQRVLLLPWAKKTQSLW
jgi:hypothetical protein